MGMGPETIEKLVKIGVVGLARGTKETAKL
jgi:hypothetical protein